MKITLCGSIAFINEMDQLRNQLEALGYEVKMPPMVEANEEGKEIPRTELYEIKKASVGNPDAWVWKNHSQRIRDHFEKVEWADAVLVANYDKNGVANYIGPNSLIEMGLAFYLNKPIFLLNPVPEISYWEEIIGLRPVVLKNNLELIATNLQMSDDIQIPANLK